MVEGKLRKLSQIAGDVLNGLFGSQSDTQYQYEDDFLYMASPSEQWDSQGDTWAEGYAEGLGNLNTGNMDGDGSWLAKAAGNGDIDSSQIWQTKFLASPVTLTDSVHFVGLTETLPTEADPPVEAQNAAYFRLVNAVGAGNWEAVVQDAGAETAVDTGIVGVDKMKSFRIDSDGVNYKFYISDVLVATIPMIAVAVNLFPVFMVVTQTAGVAQMEVDLYRAIGTRLYPT